MNTVPALPRSVFAVTLTSHGLECPTCETAAKSAATHARVTGSVSCRYSHEYASATGERHFAQVTRSTR